MDDEVWDSKYLEQFGVLSFGLSSAQGFRDTMEDKAQVLAKGRQGYLYAAVFDGHGGHVAAEFLCNQLYQVFSDIFSAEVADAKRSLKRSKSSAQAQLLTPVELQETLKKSFETMDKDLLAFLKEEAEGEQRQSGATATVALVRRDKIVVANVGDSRAVLCRRAQPVDLSAEHRVYGYSPKVASEIERIEAVGGWVKDGRVCDVLAVSRAFGDPEFKSQEGLRAMLARGVENEFWDQAFADAQSFSGVPVVVTPDVTELALTEDDEFILVATDGLWDVMTSSEVVSVARADFKRGMDAQEISEKLTQLAIQRKSQDNVAVVVVDLGGGSKGWPSRRNPRRRGMFGLPF